MSVAPTRRVALIALPDIPEVRANDELGDIIAESMRRAELCIERGDVLVVAQKIVSKAEGRLVDLGTVTPSARAQELAALCGKDARLVELMLQESREVLRCRPGVIVLEHRLGFVMANAGIDQSNIDHAGRERVLLLPVDPQRSAERLRAHLGGEIGVIVNDSFGRAWRNGVVGVALGVAGMPALVDLRGTLDRFGRALRITEIALADELASAASILMGQADEGLPAILIRGVSAAYLERSEGSVRELIRPREADLFR